VYPGLGNLCKRATLACAQFEQLQTPAPSQPSQDGRGVEDYHHRDSHGETSKALFIFARALLHSNKSALEAVHAAGTLDSLQSLDQNHMKAIVSLVKGLQNDQPVIVQTGRVMRSKRPWATPRGQSTSARIPARRNERAKFRLRSLAGGHYDLPGWVPQVCLAGFGGSRAMLHASNFHNAALQHQRFPDGKAVGVDSYRDHRTGPSLVVGRCLIMTCKAARLRYV
jgi:hypothetical protein